MTLYYGMVTDANPTLEKIHWLDALKALAQNSFIRWVWRICIIVTPFISFVLGTSFTLAQQLNDLPLVVAANSDRVTVIEKELGAMSLSLQQVIAKLDVLIQINQELISK